MHVISLQESIRPDSVLHKQKQSRAADRNSALRERWKGRLRHRMENFLVMLDTLRGQQLESYDELYKKQVHGSRLHGDFFDMFNTLCF